MSVSAAFLEVVSYTMSSAFTTPSAGTMSFWTCIYRGIPWHLL